MAYMESSQLHLHNKKTKNKGYLEIMNAPTGLLALDLKNCHLTVALVAVLMSPPSLCLALPALACRLSLTR